MQEAEECILAAVAADSGIIYESLLNERHFQRSEKARLGTAKSGSDDY